MEEELSKICSKCKENKPLTAYDIKSTGRLGRNSRCKECISEDKREAYARKVDTPLISSVPEGFSVKKVSTNRDAEGNIKQQWVSVDRDKEEAFEQAREVVTALMEPCKRLSLAIPAPDETDEELMAVYAIADAHIGMFAWDKETGADYDLQIAEDIVNDAMVKLVQSVPATKTALIANLGDFMHTDTVLNKTMGSGHVLDVDSRWGKIIQVGSRVYRNLINLALQKHEKVIVKSGIGNHDAHGSLTLAMIMQAYFENNDRVEIELPIAAFTYHTFGKNLIGISHGNGIKIASLPGIMATDRPKDWGNSTYRTYLLGHKHHREAKEFPGCTVETFRAIASKDSWTHSSGYRATRSLEALVFQKDGGEQARHIVNIR